MYRQRVIADSGIPEQKTRLSIQATSTIESDGLRSGRNRRMAMIRRRLGDMTATQRLGSIKYLLMRANLRPVCWLWLNRSSTASQRAASAAPVPIELTYNPCFCGHKELSYVLSPYLAAILIRFPWASLRSAKRSHEMRSRVEIALGERFFS